MIHLSISCITCGYQQSLLQIYKSFVFCTVSVYSSVQPPLLMEKMNVWLWLLSIFCIVVAVNGHGRLRDPPARSSAWRYGFKTPRNYDDTELFCGGWAVQHGKNGGKCGICGDDWASPVPRKNELGGEFGQGVITRIYKQGQVINTHVEITQNHLGWYELRLCPLRDELHDATQECFNRHILQRADGKGSRITVPEGQNNFTVPMKLPADLTCEHCVMQWDWICGNRWDFCGDNKDYGELGCGPQETFRGCSDVRIE